MDGQRGAPAAGAQHGDRSHHARAPTRRSAPVHSRSTFDRCLEHDDRARSARRPTQPAPDCPARRPSAAARSTPPPIRARCTSSARRRRRKSRARAARASRRQHRKRRRTRSRRLCRRGTAARSDRCGRRSRQAPQRPARSRAVADPRAIHTLAAPFADVEQRDQHAGRHPRRAHHVGGAKVAAADAAADRLPHRRARISANGIDPMRYAVTDDDHHRPVRLACASAQCRTHAGREPALNSVTTRRRFSARQSFPPACLRARAQRRKVATRSSGPQRSGEGGSRGFERNAVCSRHAWKPHVEAIGAGRCRRRFRPTARERAAAREHLDR